MSSSPRVLARMGRNPSKRCRGQQACCTWTATLPPVPDNKFGSQTPIAMMAGYWGSLVYIITFGKEPFISLANITIHFFFKIEKTLQLRNVGQIDFFFFFLLFSYSYLRMKCSPLPTLSHPLHHGQCTACLRQRSSRICHSEDFRYHPPSPRRHTHTS